ncbi:hypothetical protein FS749_015339 [Ceratobasidium sp. UAMH 11750]|nr:hypothetical protein FS749_015339 [Ceratobasidium sp. UAMH 11750]
MDPNVPSKRARFGPHLNPFGRAPGTSLQSQSSSSATSANQPNSQIPTPAPATSMPASSSSTQHTRLFMLKNSFKGLGKVATMIPPLQPVVDLLTNGMDGLSISAENSQDYESFSTNITSKVETLKGHLDHRNPVILTESISNTIEELRKQAEYISEKQGHSKGKRLMDAGRDEADLMRCYRNVDALLQRLNVDIGMTVSRTSHETLEVANRSLHDAQLVEMRPVKEARYDACGKGRRNRCTPGTRVPVLEALVNWANDEAGAKVYWMNGMAGTGKTTIACSLCYTLKDTNQLAASFFCSRQLPGCRDVSRIVPTLAYQLARRSPIFKHQLCQVLEDDPDICSVDVARQFEMLINEPLRKMDQAIQEDRMVIVVDALDECSDSSGAQLVLDALFQFAADLPVKFFVTCRPDPTLFDRVSSEKQAVPSIFHLHNIEHSVIQADIETYLTAELAPIGVSGREIKLLAERSGKLFIYAATAVQYIRPTNARVDPQSRLQTVLGVAPKSSGKIHERLDELYTTILSAALENMALEPSEVANIRLVLHTVLCAREPMTIEALACLLGLKSAKEARLALEPLGSVLYVSDCHLPLSTLHASFPDYMRDQERSKQFWFDPATHHDILSRQCFATMKDLLRFNICSLESSFVPDEDVPDFSNQVEKAIPRHLFYACRYWSEHLVQSCSVHLHTPMLVEFLRDRVLFWMEVMSLKKCMELGASILPGIYGWMKRANLSDDACALCLDAQRFAAVFAAGPAHTSTPHIYVSILALWDRGSPMWTQYGMRANGLGAEGSALNDRKSGRLVSWIARGGITSAAASRDGRRVVTSSRNHELHVWGTYTGTLLAGPFIGHTGVVHSVVFSRDGSRITSASDDKTVRVWDAHTGHALGAPFQGHRSAVRCVVFSPDGSHLASGSEDCTIRIWDTQTGQTVAGPFRGHSNSVTSTAYSPDGGRILSVSGDTIYIWNAQTGDIIAGPLEVGGSWCPASAFSPDGSHFVSGNSEGAIQIWDAQTGRKVANCFTEHRSPAISVAFNPSGTHIVSGHKYGVIHVWDMQTKHQDYQHDNNPKLRLFGGFHLIENPFLNDCHIFSASSTGTICIFNTQAAQAPPDAAVKQVHLAVRSVHFLPDGCRIASGCDDGTICIWDIHAGDMLVGPFKTRSDTGSFALSPNGGCIASGSWRKTICIWDTQTGRRVAGPLEGHTRAVCSVAYSPDGGFLVSGSDDCTVRVWDSQTGCALAGPFRGHTGWVYSVAFSPNGRRVVSGSSDKTVRVWDARTGQAVVGPLKGHTKSVSSVAFSPDGSHIVSGSDDYTVRVWDAQTGHAVGEPFEGHTSRVTSVAYSPNGSRIVSGSRDCTVRVWDAETGHTIAGPYKSHTKWVTSVAYSPDGSYFASGSEDGTIRIWPSQIGSDVDPLDNWRMTEDGWIVGDDSSMLLWVPQELRPALILSQQAGLLRPEGFLRLRFKDACIGSRWAKCFSG